MNPQRWKAPMKWVAHQLLWRLIEGAVADAMRAHPDYFTARGHRLAGRSITKRVAGQLVGHYGEARKRGLFGACLAKPGTCRLCHPESGRQTLSDNRPRVTAGIPAPSHPSRGRE